MAMSAGPSDEGAPMSDINTTPLVDVMLVLLIIFLITVPAAIQSVPVALPKVVLEATVTKPENVSLSIRGEPDGSCGVYWNQTRVNAQELTDRGVEKLKAEIEKQGGVNAKGLELPEVHIRGDVNTPYRCIGGAVYNMQRAGFAKVGFISEPAPGSVPITRH
jgi:biopolymer transport protein ExbD